MIVCQRRILEWNRLRKDLRSFQQLRLLRTVGAHLRCMTSAIYSTECVYNLALTAPHFARFRLCQHSVYIKMFFSKILVSLTTTCVFLTPVLALSSPPSGSITVGPKGKYAKISDALADKSSSVCITRSISHPLRSPQCTEPCVTLMLGLLHLCRNL